MRISNVRLFFLPVHTRVPYHFGAETMTEVICARVCVRVRDDDGREAEGWGETPLSVQWVWPASIPFVERQAALLEFCRQLVPAWAGFDFAGHPFEIGHAFLQAQLPALLASFNSRREPSRAMPRLAALVCCSPFDLALYDAFGNLHGLPVYDTLGPEHLAHDLSAYLEPASAAISFVGKYPSDFLVSRKTILPAWHSVGGADPLDEGDKNGSEPDDEYPVCLRDWILRDGLRCLKVKVFGRNGDEDYERLVKVAKIGRELGVRWLCADYNCTAPNVPYVTDMLDRLMRDNPEVYGMLLYVEQPFPYEIEDHLIDVHPIAARKPLFMDESAHDWRSIRLGRELGWTNVALKTCKTQTGALLSLCWARAHGMTLMVQDLTNPMMAMIPHALLAAHAGTIMGLECNAMQYYPDASRPEATVHPGLYSRRAGHIDLNSLHGPGFSYRLEDIQRTLPTVDAEA